MSRVLWSAFIAAFVLAGGVSPFARQEGPGTPQAQEEAALPQTYAAPPVVTLVDGSAQLVRQGQASAAATNMPLIAGDRLTTGTGRVAVRFPDGSWLHLDNQTSVDFLSLSLMRLLDGRVIFGAAGRGGERPSLSYHIDAAAGSVQVEAAGEYHVATYADGSVPEVELAVVSGVATLMNERGNVEVEAGERSVARAGTSPEYAHAFNSARLDDFEQWSDAQESREVGGASSQYLPTELTAYASTFDEDGRWMNTSEYGYVWYPRVTAGWRPYYNGYWDYVGPYGWTWIGHDPWCWPTHHYGRWGVNAGVWFWIPGAYWAPAWVSWGFSSGYVGWCPLGHYNRPVYGLHGGYYGGRGGGGYDPWHAWTVVPRNGFGPRPVPNYALTGPRLAAMDRGQFSATGRLPGPPRGAARASSGLASPRTGAAAAMPRALASVPSSEVARSRAPRDAFPLPSATASTARAFRGQSQYSVPGSAGGNANLGRATPRYSAPGSSPSYSTPRYSAPGSSPSYSAPRSSPGYAPRSSAPGIDRPSAPGTAAPRAGAPRTYSTPDYSPRYSAPRGADRPSAPGVTTPRATPRTYSPPNSSPRYSQPSAPAYSPRYSVPRAPEYSPRGYSYSRPVPSAPAAPRSYSAPSYAAPRGYSRPPASVMPRGYSAPSAPAAPRSYGAPSAPRSYSAPSAPRSYSAPAPRTYSGPSGGMSAPRGPAAGGPSRSPSAGAPSRGPAPQAQPRGRGGR